MAAQAGQALLTDLCVPRTRHGQGCTCVLRHRNVAERPVDLFLHNGALTIGDLKGALGRRSVTVEHLRYNPDGTLKPVVQTTAGVSRPPPKD